MKIDDNCNADNIETQNYSTLLSIGQDIYGNQYCYTTKCNGSLVVIKNIVSFNGHSEWWDLSLKDTMIVVSVCCGFIVLSVFACFYFNCSSSVKSNEMSDESDEELVDGGKHLNMCTIQCKNNTKMSDAKIVLLSVVEERNVYDMSAVVNGNEMGEIIGGRNGDFIQPPKIIAPSVAHAISLLRS